MDEIRDKTTPCETDREVVYYRCREQGAIGKTSIQGGKMIVWPTGEEATVTVEQKNAIYNIMERFNLPTDVITVHPEFGGDGAIMLHVSNIWFGIEPDGYAHT
jgi:hypothetical protein